MEKRSLGKRWMPWAMAASAGTLPVLSDCDADVRTTVLTGLQATTQTLADTAISALFLALQEDDEDEFGSFTTNP